MVIKDGRFGPYVTDGETNASLRKGDDVASITVARAAELLADRRAAPPAPRRRASASKASTTRKKAGTTARSVSKRSLPARTKD
jgi:DNA topoisomerase I